MAKKLLLINGPNLNLLGSREPEKYGSTTLDDVQNAALAQAQAAGAVLAVFQSNHEGAIIDRIHHAKKEGIEAIIINPGAYTHTSVAIRDALSGVAIPFVEVHITNIHQREEFRHFSYLSGIAKAVLCGFGVAGYPMAISYALNSL
jgi:3-dehydroquinate dehydratase-2